MLSQSEDGIFLLGSRRKGNMTAFKVTSWTLLTFMILGVAWFFNFAIDARGGPSLKADAIVVEKSKRRLLLMHRDEVLKSYRVSLGREPAGPKTHQGDGKTPEGRYVIDSRNAQSKFHLALHVSYPNAADITNAKKRGMPAGGDVMIHGLPNGLGALNGLFKFADWTEGCIAVTNSELRKFGRLCPMERPLKFDPDESRHDSIRH